jgi:hypothetical protein
VDYAEIEWSQRLLSGPRRQNPPALHCVTLSWTGLSGVRGLELVATSYNTTKIYTTLCIFVVIVVTWR